MIRRPAVLSVLAILSLFGCGEQPRPNILLGYFRHRPRGSCGLCRRPPRADADARRVGSPRGLVLHLRHQPAADPALAHVDHDRDGALPPRRSQQRHLCGPVGGRDPRRAPRSSGLLNPRRSLGLCPRQPVRPRPGLWLLRRRPQRGTRAEDVHVQGDPGHRDRQEGGSVAAGRSAVRWAVLPLAALLRPSRRLPTTCRGGSPLPRRTLPRARSPTPTSSWDASWRSSRTSA